MKKCTKDCKHFKYIKNTDSSDMGICSFPISYIPVKLEGNCFFEPQPYTCKDCTNFLEYSCLTVNGEDQPCMFFVDKKEDVLYNILYEWKLRKGTDEEVEKTIKKVYNKVNKDFKEL